MDVRGNVRVETGQKRVRVMFGGTVVADTIEPLLVWEKPYYPTYYFRTGEARMDLFMPTDDVERSSSRGEAQRLSVVVGDRRAEGAVTHCGSSPIPELSDTVAFDWAAMDHWFEEDEEVFVHARDPYKRIDALHSSRHVRFEVDGIDVADSVRPVILFETGLPARFYLPKIDVRMEMLVPTSSSTACPYKGTARYWNVVVGGTVHEDLAWGYDAPLSESAPIAGLISFYNERVDIRVDGVRVERPRTVFG